MDTPMRILNLSVGITVGLTALLLAIEASKLNMGDEKDLKRNGRRYEGAATWFCYIILLWLVFYPWYFSRRAKYGLKNWSAGALAVAFIFIASLLFWNNEIEVTQTEIKQKIEKFENQFDWLK